MTQSEFDRQAEITRLLLEGVSSTHVCKSAQLESSSNHETNNIELNYYSADGVWQKNDWTTFP